MRHTPLHTRIIDLSICFTVYDNFMNLNYKYYFDEKTPSAVATVKTYQ